MFDKIPAEMRAFRQWVCWKLVERENAKPTKIPYNPLTGFKASVTDPLTWVDYETAVYHSVNYSGIGFTLTPIDPYGFIDLDNTHGNQVNWERQLTIFKEFDSYAELSPSGSGLHIIVKGKIPDGRKRADIEIYSSGRYMTMTGNVYRDAPINEHGVLLNQLWAQMGAPAALLNYEDNSPEKHTDDEIINIARIAANGDKFTLLAKGEWEGLYPSQSEADFAFVDILAFYTQNRNQIRRIFAKSALGARNKKTTIRGVGYIDHMISRSFDRQLPPMDIDGLMLNGGMLNLGTRGEEPGGTPPLAVSTEPAITPGSGEQPQATTLFPLGLVGEVAQFILEASPRRVPIISLAASVALLSGITGRGYNVSGTGLNQYIMVVANTGAGKDVLSHGPSKLMQYMQSPVPAASGFIGPGELVSSAGLIKHLAKNPCFVSTMGEFGKKLMEMSNPRATHLQSVLRLFLQLYSKSGYGNVLDPMVYSDITKNTSPILSPALTLLGEGTPESFYGNLNENMITDGLLPRFLVFEHKGKNPYMSENHHEARPSFDLVTKLASLCAECLTRQQMGEPRTVQLDTEAKLIFDNFGREATDKVNETKLEITRQLWNRAHIKALKLAALIAVGINYLEPTITKNEAKYCIDIVTKEVESMIEKFANGDVGVMTSHNIDEYKQVKEVGRAIQEWTRPDNKNHITYKITDEMHKDNIILHNALQMKLYPSSSFKNDKFGANSAIKKAIQYFIDAGDIAEVSRNQMKTRYNSIAKAYVVTNMQRFSEYLK